jgi:predicted PurR-regulated permease PerM
VVGPRGGDFVDLAGLTVRSVARGVIGIAVIQALLLGLGLVVAGVPGAGLIALIGLGLGIVQLGVFLPVLGVLIWSWSVQETQTALLLTVYLVAVTLIDNVLRPLVLGKGLPTPMLVILVGLIGGTLSYGLIGVFLGPIVLAVFYELVVGWVRLGEPAAPPRPGGIE